MAFSPAPGEQLHVAQSVISLDHPEFLSRLVEAAEGSRGGQGNIN
jgi:hypothetical protein